MAGSATLSVISTSSVPKITCNKSDSCGNKVRVSIQRNPDSITFRFTRNYSRRRSPTRLNAGLTEIEPDLNEDPKDRWATYGVSQEDFIYGEYDDHHTYHEGHEKGTFWGSVAEDYAAVGPPTGFQGLISWLFLPAIAAGMYFNVPGEYLYIGAAVFTVVFCIIEMDKPSEPHNFEPQIYNMERGSRDKLIADYNTMDIWDFNEKYGDLWDFTVKKDDIMKR
ncbi:photosynthetic NDH subunit of subcomplex B 5, chloroplastic [Cornus florida]|uniref:photosynthetic NDH subunit of subcomplex B 5, chloroplastic n=1 Tax=Cornus florida TaxID=4283 RepID=UPI00289BDE29|nr:photosynthetic NDH subunit of subcomplex B 5, chloroplastic [Cornus florida]XP_059632427.1 photosynthetic NDH subunit of subcomplex B 5, chloroplastic [Cornus florida]